MHVPSSPAILYFGTPVVLIASVNEDGTHNLAPMSSAFWLGWRCVIGLAAGSKTTQNLVRTGECVLNLPSVNEVAAVNRLALTTGSHPVPATKRARGYRHVHDKFGEAGLTADPADTVHAPRVRECPVQMEAVVEATHGVAERDERLRGHIRTFELRIQRVHVDDAILVDGEPDRVDPDKWRPLIMSFQRFYGLEAGQLSDSALARIPEGMYRSPDVGGAVGGADCGVMRAGLGGDGSLDRGEIIHQRLLWPRSGKSTCAGAADCYRLISALWQPDFPTAKRS